MTVLSVEAPRQIVCPSCGDVRWLSAHTARRAERGERRGLCTRCRFPPRISAAERRRLARWWLARYDDATIAAIAHAFGVEAASAENIAANRARLRAGT